jgi:hypothetical protein
MDFIGRTALMKQRDEGVKRMYVQLIVQDHDHEVDLWPWGTEPIYRNGRYVGSITTTGYGFTFQKQVQSRVALSSGWDKFCGSTDGVLESGSISVNSCKGGRIPA